MYYFCYEKAIVPTNKTKYVAVDFVKNVDGLLKA